MKKRSSRMAILGAMAMGLAAIAGGADGAVAQQAAPVQQSSNSGNSGTAKINTIKEQVQELTPVRHVGGTNLFAGYGIPPKVYGMHYVRRGTHKRTNRK